MKNFRPVWAEIDLSAIRQNLAGIRKRIPSCTGIIAVVKANAYGHGIVEVSRAVVRDGVKFLGVTSVDEGIILRKNKVKAHVLVLGSLYPFESFGKAIEHGLIPTIASIEGLSRLDSLSGKSGKVTPYHLEVDTGMGRTGLSVPSVEGFIIKTQEFRNTKLAGVYTHFASADSDEKYTREQISSFNEAVTKIKSYGYGRILCHASNSSAILKYPEANYDMVRPGLALYGMPPFGGAGKIISLKPALSWKTRIVYLKKVPAGKFISYGNTYKTGRDSLIATLSAGYSDGYSRLLSNTGSVLVNGRRAKIAGRVTMDMTMADVTGINNVKVGDEAVLMGTSGEETITAGELAELTGTISYEVLCNINTRVERVYRNE